MALAVGVTAGCAVAEPTVAHGAADGAGGLARVVFLRPSPEASTANFPILDEQGNVITLVGPESQAMASVAPGDRRFELRAFGKADLLRADLAPGKTYYVLVSRRELDGRAVWAFTALRGDRDWLAEVQKAARSSATLGDDVDAGVADTTNLAVPLPSERADPEELRAHTLRVEDGR